LPLREDWDIFSALFDGTVWHIVGVVPYYQERGIGLPLKRSLLEPYKR
jgi:hypothetical protein